MATVQRNQYKQGRLLTQRIYTQTSDITHVSIQNKYTLIIC